LQKQGALNISMLRLGCVFPPSIKISGCAPDRCRFFATPRLLLKDNTSMRWRSV